MAGRSAWPPNEHVEPNNTEHEIYPTHYKGVKALVDAGIHAVPENYIRPLEQRPVLSDSHLYEEDQLPMIDLADLHGDGEGRAAVVEAIGQACQQWGFFLVKNHGVPESAMAEMMRVAREFFHLPTEEKMRYFSADPKCAMRYATSFNVKEEKILSWRDFVRYPCEPIQEMMPLWPDKPADFREINAQYCTKIGKLARALVGAISESLGVSIEYINDLFGDHSQIMGCNFYPTCPNPDLALGLQAHSDPWGITLLMQDNVGGLQIWHEDHWVHITPTPNTLVINLGDTIQVLSNGKYKSAIHRVVANDNKEQLSVVTACGPSMDTFLAPIPKLLNSCHPPIYNGILYKEFIDIKLNNVLNNEPTLDLFTHINI